MRKVKIVCTIGPSSEDRGVLRQLIQAGMNVARLNFSHGDYQEQGDRIRLLRELRAELDVPLAILLDTKGPEIRLGKFAKGQEELVAGQTFTITTRDVPGTNEIVSISFADLPQDVSVGTQILLDDGLIELTVESVDGQDIRCTVVNGGTIKNLKGVNLPGTTISIPFLSDKDREDIAFGCKMGINYIAASFVQSAQNILQLRALLDDLHAYHVSIIAKIENRAGVNNIEEILEAADGIMVARGDLGVEIPIEEVPLVQKRLIRLANIAAKPVITATQMLESMIHNPRPTRAEANDVANSILDGTDAIMLSGETAAGKFPVEAVRTMDRIANSITILPRKVPGGASRTITAAVCHACHNIAQDLGAKAIVTPTKSGTTAMMVARHRPECPIVACVIDEHAYHALALYWGVYPLRSPEVKTTDELTEHSVALVRDYCHLADGDIVVITAGVPLSLSGTTNLIHVQYIGNILLRGRGEVPGRARGRANYVSYPTDTTEFAQGDILVSLAIDERFDRFLALASAVVISESDDGEYAIAKARELGIPLLRAQEGTLSRIKEGAILAVDAEAGLIYNVHA